MIKFFKNKKGIELLRVLIYIAVAAAIVIIVWLIAEGLTPEGGETAKGLFSTIRGAFS